MTMTALLALLGFGILAAGILIGRYYVPDDRALRRTAGHSEAYMRALEHLLRRDDSAAIAELRSVVADNVTALEPYFALAALFRSRGEWERAVRVHQAIALRKDSKKPHRLRARYELGLDFRAAGMPRRSTRAMEEVLEADPRHQGALRALCGLYEEQGRYGEAAEVWARLGKLIGESSLREPHLWAAAAQQAAEAGNIDAARSAIKRAKKLASDDPHVWAASADIEAARENAKTAAEHLRTALELAPDWAIYLVPGMLEAQLGSQEKRGGGDADTRYRAAAEATVRELESIMEEVGENPHLTLAVAELRSHYDADAALIDFRRAAELYPDLLPSRVASSRLTLANGEPGEIRDELIALVGPEGALSWATEGAWRCTHCTARREAFFWRCQSCRQWGTAALDVGARVAERAPEAPRERRGSPRRLWSESQRALPSPSVDGGPEAKLGDGAVGSGLFDRARGWLKGTFGRARH